MGIWGHYLEGWSNHSAGPTPSSKEIHQNQLVSLDNTIKVILQRNLQELVSLSQGNDIVYGDKVAENKYYRT